MNTSVIRLKTSLQDSVIDLLNEQIAMEAHSSATYLSMAAWCYAQGLNGSGYFFKKQSDEEREHMLKLFHYVADAGGLPVSPDVTKIERSFEGLRDVFVKSLEAEIAITTNFNRISDHCYKVKDFQTARFLQWYLDEQLEEEQQARRCLEIYDIIGTDAGGLYRIDKEVYKLKAKESE
ncbi:ferritin [Chryseosolibacter indicus]|uniref:Ferritin n=1 Tax=Chryseosolibacter indicus TaxID=2782351 RepID=A0ABS5VLV2_9BACT|nr:ferritin [Chryseosolibacter indicus]MBT1701689.1 ferritin [Chryseosolibacter indicus]